MAKKNKKFDLDPRFGKLIDDLLWWAMLVVAVLAIPAVAVIMISLVHKAGLIGDMYDIPVFIGVCWLASWLLIRHIRRNKL